MTGIENLGGVYNQQLHSVESFEATFSSSMVPSLRLLPSTVGNGDVESFRHKAISIFPARLSSYQDVDDRIMGFSEDRVPAA